jgi:hypothetical protein
MEESDKVALKEAVREKILRSITLDAAENNKYDK